MILKNKKKIIIGIIAIAVVICGVVGGVYAASKMGMQTVSVYPVSDLYEEMDTSTEVLTGEITTDAAQTVNQKNGMNVKKIYVKEGQKVKVGTKLVKYDTAQLKLNLDKKKLQKQKLELSQTTINKEIAKLKSDQVKAQKAEKKAKADTKKDTTDSDSDSDSEDDSDTTDTSLDDASSYPEQIREKQQQYRENTLTIKQYALDISKIERQIASATVKSSVVGTVTKIGKATKDSTSGSSSSTDKSSSDGSSLTSGYSSSRDTSEDSGDDDSDDTESDTSIPSGTSDNVLVSIVGSTGYYIKGNLSEIQLDTIKVGQILHGTTYESGTEFDAAITEISPYPTADTSMIDSSGQNSSYYPFLAKVTDDTELNSQEGVDLQIVQDTESSDFLWIDKAFIRTDGGKSYVYIADKNKKLKKKIIKVNRIIDGTTAEISSGLTMDDKIAFPYGTQIKEGAPTQKSSVDSLYE